MSGSAFHVATRCAARLPAYARRHSSGVTSRSVVARPADRGVVACTNHFLSKELSTGERCPRWETFEKSFGKEKWLRLSYATSLKNLEKAFDRIEKFLDS